MSSGSADRQQRRHLPRSAVITVALVALIATIIGGFIVLLQPGNVAADEIRTEPGRTPGVNPFMLQSATTCPASGRRRRPADPSTATPPASMGER